MKAKHWIALGLLAVAILYLFHNYQMHGGVSGFRTGLGLGGTAA